MPYIPRHRVDLAVRCTKCTTTRTITNILCARKGDQATTDIMKHMRTLRWRGSSPTTIVCPPCR